jgi:acetyltransferase-like isoleucine patch superfamily enzyme
VRPAGDAGERGREGAAAGVVAALTAYAYLWRCRRVGARARTLGKPLLGCPGNVELGADVVIDSRGGQVELVCRGRGRLVVGDGAHLGPRARIHAARYVELGDRVRVGAGCVVSDAEGADEGEVWIGDDVTLGDGARVLPGTVIGAGAVVAPGAVVRGRIAAGARVAAAAAPAAEGVPC